MAAFFKFAASLIALACAPIALAQTAAPVIPAPDIGKIIAQTISEHDIELVTSALRDGLHGKTIDEKRLAPLSQKMEGFAAIMLRELLTQSMPMIDGLEHQLKQELRRLKEPKQ